MGVKRTAHRILAFAVCAVVLAAGLVSPVLQGIVLALLSSLFRALGFSLLLFLLAVPAGRPSGLWMRARRVADTYVALRYGGVRAPDVRAVARAEGLLGPVPLLALPTPVLAASGSAMGLDVVSAAERRRVRARRLERYVAAMGVRASVAAAVSRMRALRFDSALPAHADVLRRLWRALAPQDPSHSPRKCPPVPSEAWKDLGFQGTDPATDMRSLGVFGARLLASYAERNAAEARAILGRAADPDSWWPFAAVALNIADFVAALLADGHLDRAIVATVGVSLGRDAEKAVSESDAVDALVPPFGDALRAFDAAWTDARPANVLAFASVFADVRERFVRSLHAH